MHTGSKIDELLVFLKLFQLLGCWTVGIDRICKQVEVVKTIAVYLYRQIFRPGQRKADCVAAQFGHYASRKGAHGGLIDRSEMMDEAHFHRPIEIEVSHRGTFYGIFGLINVENAHWIDRHRLPVAALTHFHGIIRRCKHTIASRICHYLCFGANRRHCQNRIYQFFHMSLVNLIT